MSSKDSAPGEALGQVTINPGRPIEITEVERLSPNSNRLGDGARRLGRTLRAYLIATKELLEGKYSNLRAVAPPHMTSDCLPKALVFSDGILIRYDRENNPDLRVFVGTNLDLSLTDMAPLVSESFIHCTTNPSEYDPGERSIAVSIDAVSPAGEHRGQIARHRIFAVTALPTGDVRKTGYMNRPMPLVSARNEFDLTMRIGLVPEHGRPEQMALTRTRFRVPVGWEAIELYPPYEADIWNPTFAPLWAENDLLAAVLQQNLRENQFHALDPNAEARKRMAKLIADCERLLSGAEEPLHQFIKANPALLSPTHTRVWPKLKLGKRDTDFVFRQPSGDYLLVELEKPSRRLFRGDGHQHSDLTHAIGQIVDWRRYIEDNLGTVQREMGLDGISSSPPSLIVIGRSSSLSAEDKRKLVTLDNFTPRLKIMTYDDLLANAKATVENILGPLWDLGPTTEVYFLRGT